MKKLSVGNKNIHFKIIAILLPLIFLVIMEILLRVFSYGNDVHLIIPHKAKAFQDYYIVNPSVGEKYFSRFQATSGTNDMFLKVKPENGFRIFVMGSSTLVGYPYDKNLMASRILQQRLQDAYPNKAIEVVNTAFTAINTVTLKDFIDQILDYEPDAILIYAGHNEFYGAFGIGSNETNRSPLFRTLHFKLMNFRIYQFIRSSINWTLNKFMVNSDDTSKGTLMKRIVNDKDITYKSEKYKIGIKQFQDNITYILKKANKKQVPVFLSDLVSNIKDLLPFDKANINANAKYKDALKALTIGDTIGAKKYFYEAKDLDPVRFRASEDINEIIYNLAKQQGVYFIPSKEWFCKASPGGLIGNNLITEHVHPNIEGQFVLADAFYTKIVESKLIDITTNSATTKNKQYYRFNWGYTALDSLIGAYKIKQLKSCWPFTSLNNETTFRDTCKATNMIDSLAFTILLNPETEFATLHNQLGEIYESRSQNYLAFKEYEAITKIYPYRSEYYNKVANCLLKLNDLYAAEKYLRKSLKIYNTCFAHTLIGEIEFIKCDFNEAINAYKAALKLADEENIDTNYKINLLRSLYKSYILNNEIEKAAAIQNMFIEKGYQIDMRVPKPEFNYVRFIPWNIEQTFIKAQKSFSTNIDSSYIYLLQCLAINDCPLVNFYMGNILYQKKDSNAVLYYNKAYEVFRKDPNFLARYCISNVISKNKTRAINILNELTALSPNNEIIPQLKEQIFK